MSIAQKTKVVEVVPYDPEWKLEFDRIKEQLLSYVGDLIITIEHVGVLPLKDSLLNPS